MNSAATAAAPTTARPAPSARPASPSAPGVDVIATPTASVIMIV